MQLFAADDKTEDPTPRRKEEARKKGQVVKSTELVSAINLMALTLFFLNISPKIWDSCSRMLISYLRFDGGSLTRGNLGRITLTAVFNFARLALPVLLIAFLSAAAGNILQIGFLYTPAAITPQLNRVNPISGLQRIFSKRALFELLKALLKVSLVGLVAWQFIRNKLEMLFMVLYQNPGGMWEIIRSLSLGLSLRIAVTFLVLALADYCYQRYEYNKSMKMSKQEIKEELKQMEGDPHLKARIREVQRKIALQRMLQDIPSATVVVTNPTHLAVALRYREEEDVAPVVVAKGAGYIAQRIRERAQEHQIPLVENKEVARMLYEQVELGQAIPVEMYQAVAEILAHVYRMKGRSF
ncbi:MAG: flagellar biosynthesis protein FlhB [Firmicutes bacterium]|nr:flagellar biosynthesis protein FlhB [Bacillota bacterium]